MVLCFLPFGKNALFINNTLFCWRQAVRFSVYGSAVHLFYVKMHCVPSLVAKQIQKARIPSIFGGIFAYSEKICIQP